MWDTVAMPILNPVAFIDKTDSPFVWACSECGEVFALERMTPIPTTTQIMKVNANFEVHCKHSHTGKVVGLPVPKVREDSSQAASRVVREATENK
jgi:hypothetical protein